MSTRSDGFAVMDVSTSICDEPKFRRLARENPELVAPAFTAYVAVMAESWKAGRRLTVEHSWPGFLAFDQAVCDALRRVGLVDGRGLVNAKAWRGWYLPAATRRSKSRDRWARYNANRDGDTAPPPRGNNADTATSVPPVPSAPSDRPSGPPASAGARGEDDALARQRTREEALAELSEQFKAGAIDEMAYRRQRKALGAA